MKPALLFLITLLLTLVVTSAFSQAILINHNCTDITQIPESAILQAKSSLHIAYGHTSHGSQLVDGMNGLVDFMNGLGYTHNLYDFDWGGPNGALDFYDTPFSGADDLGAPDFTSWESATRNYLDTHPIINVVIWSWCGQVSWASEEDINTYLGLMNGLEQDYPGVHFVYMTGHLDGSGEYGDLNIRNQQIRDYCDANDKTLYDFADIESYDPDGTTNYMVMFANDACDYDSNGDGSQDRNWAEDWQNTHTVDVDWYNCGSAHSQPLNANQKAYAAWWLWARIAGWSGPVQDSTPPSVPQNLTATAISETRIDLTWNASSDAQSGVARYNLYRDDNYIGYSANLQFTDSGLTPGTTYTYEVTAVNGAGAESARSASARATTPSDNQPPARPTDLSASAVSSSRIDLSWTASTDNSDVVSYRVYRDGQETGSSTGTTYSDTGLLPATTYTYQVSACDAADNESTLSDAVQASTLDPSQETFTVWLESTDEVDDSFLYANDPDANYGDEGYVETIDRFIIRFNLPSELSNKLILSANLGLYVWNQTNYQDNQYMQIFRVTRDWDENQVTWNRATASNSWTTPGGDYEDHVYAQILHQQGQENWDHTFYPEADITALVQMWADGTENNNGMLIQNNSVTGIGLKASEFGEGTRPYLDISYTDKPLTGISNRTAAINPILYPNYPNPFNPSTEIRFELPEPAFVTLTIYDLLGKKIITLIDEKKSSGTYIAEWNVKYMASGIYICCLKAGEFTQTRKLTLQK